MKLVIKTTNGLPPKQYGKINNESREKQWKVDNIKQVTLYQDEGSTEPGEANPIIHVWGGGDDEVIGMKILTPVNLKDAVWNLYLEKKENS